MDGQLAAQLDHGCAQLGLDLQSAQQAQLLEYLELLLRWNRTYNLTAVREPQQMVTRHLLDSLAIAAHIREHRLIDVGAGAGLPGIPLAILQPERQFDLLDSNGKKTRFLFQVKTALRLANMEVLHQRVQSFHPPEPYDAVLSRAFASLEDMVASCRHLLVKQGRFLAMKGTYPAVELASMSAFCERVAVHSLQVPGLNEQRHLVAMTLREGETG